MAEQQTVRAHHQSILNKAADHLQRGDVRSYWNTIGEISPRYAKLAGQVSANQGFAGKGAHERLQDAAEDHLGRRFTDQEMQELTVRIARGDHSTRQSNLRVRGTAGITLKQSDDYHAEVFEGADLPKDTYTLHNVVRSLGPAAGAIHDTDDPKDPVARARLDDALKQHNPELGERLRNGLANASDALSFVSDAIEGYGHDFQDWTDERQRRVREVFEGPPVENPDNSKAPTPEAAPRSDAAPSRAADPKLVAALARDDGPMSAILAKPPADLTENEVRQVMVARREAETDVEREHLFGIEKAFFDDKFGTGPVARDATGRIIEPQPIRPINRIPVAARSPVPEPGAAELKQLVASIAAPRDGETTGDVVKGLQMGLNILNRNRPAARADTAGALFKDLRPDGDAGPKTRRAFQTAAAALGPEKIKEGLALGRFQQFAETPQHGNLAARTHDVFGDLFRAPAQPTPKNAPEGLGLQSAINDLGRANLGRAFQPIKEDGHIGAKTVEAFRRVLAPSGAEAFTDRLGSALGFLGGRTDSDDRLFG